MATWTQNFGSGWAQLIFTVSKDSVSAENSTTKLKCVLQIKKLQACSSQSNGNANIYMKVNGTKCYTSDSFDISNLKVGSTQTLATKYVTVKHDTEGSAKTVSCEAKFISSRQLKDATITGKTFTCAAIDRKSTFTMTGNTIGTYITFNIAKKVSTAKHVMKVFFGDDKRLKETITLDYTGVWLPDLQKYASLCTTKKTMSLWLQLITYASDGTTLIGTEPQTEYQFVIPEDGTKPKHISFSFSDTTGYHDKSLFGCYVQGRSNLRINTPAYTAAANGQYGASIKQVEIYLNGNKIKTHNTMTNSTTLSATSHDVIPTQSGENEIKIVVTDSRGHKSSMSQSATIVPYSNPFIKSYKVQRFSDKVRVTYDVSFSSLNGTNRFHIDINGGGLNKTVLSDTTKASGTFEFDVTEGVKYSNVRLKVEDRLSDHIDYEPYTDYFDIPDMERIINISGNKELSTGIGFGMKASPQAYDFNYKVRCYNGDFVTKNNNQGFYVTNSAGNPEPGIFKNETNLWVGATKANGGQHITGSTHISAGTNTDGIYVCKPIGDGKYQDYLALDSGNYSRYVANYADPKPVQLYNNASGTYSTITWSNAKTSDFKFLEIFYTDGYSACNKSTRVFVNYRTGINVELSYVYPNSGSTDLTATLRTSVYTINSTTLTWGRGKNITLTNGNSVEVTNVSDIGSNPGQSQIKILGIYGYK